MRLDFYRSIKKEDSFCSCKVREGSVIIEQKAPERAALVPAGRDLSHRD